MRAALNGLVVMVALVGLPSLAGARGPHGPGPMFHPARIDALAAEVGVDAATVTKIKDLAFKSEQDAIGLRADLQRAEMELMRLIDLDAPDQVKVMKQVEQLGQIETRLRKNHVQLLLNVRALLTAEQRQRLEALVHDRPGRGGPGGLGGGRPGCGPGPCPGGGDGRPGFGPGSGGGPGPKGPMGPGGRQMGPRGPR